jgi:hypothetical protein
LPCTSPFFPHPYHLLNPLENYFHHKMIATNLSLTHEKLVPCHLVSQGKFRYFVIARYRLQQKKGGQNDSKDASATKQTFLNQKLLQTNVGSR